MVFQYFLYDRTWLIHGRLSKESQMVISISLFLFVFFVCLTSDHYEGSFATSDLGLLDNSENRTENAIPIKHVIVIIQGGRSFDHYFGTYSDANGLPNNTKIPLNPFDPVNQEYVEPFHLETTKTLSPLYGSEYNKIAYNNGSMNGFVYLQDLYGLDKELVMGYYDYKDIPYYWNFASEYALADNFFSPTMGSGLINYLFFYAGDSYNYGTAFIPRQGFTIGNTIFDNLENKNLDWKIYMRNYDPNINYTNDLVRTKNVSDTQIVRNPLLGIPRFVQNQTLNSHIVDLSQYYDDLIRNGTLPNVSYILLPGLNEQAPSNLAAGQQLVASIIFALMQSDYWKDSAIILTYDQAGGWYDHVAPPPASEDNNYREFGFRVPALIISPYAKEGYIDNTFYDATSVLKFIETVFGLPPLTENDKKANNMLNAFDFNNAPREPFIPPMVYTQDLETTNQELTIPQYQSNNNTVQVIYGTLLGLLTLPGLIYYFYIKKKLYKQKVS